MAPGPRGWLLSRVRAVVVAVVCGVELFGFCRDFGEHERLAPARAGDGLGAGLGRFGFKVGREGCRVGRGEGLGERGTAHSHRQAPHPCRARVGASRDGAGAVVAGADDDRRGREVGAEGDVAGASKVRACGRGREVASGEGCERVGVAGCERASVHLEPPSASAVGRASDERGH